MAKLIYTSKGEEYFNFAHHIYHPSVSTDNKLSSISLLLNSFPSNSNLYVLVQKIKENLGLNNTIWGIKNFENKIFWEFYFYNYKRASPLISMANINNIINPFLKSSIKVNDDLPYFMFSIDILPSFFKNEELNGSHIYIGCEGKYPSGVCYLLNKDGLTMENYYTFYDAEKEMEALIFKIRNSAFIDFKKINIDEILLPELINCKSICIAHKQKNDGIYYSGINIDQLLFFLKKFNYPASIISFIENHKLKLDHLQYDVSYDYKMEDNQLKIIKSGYYGTF